MKYFILFLLFPFSLSAQTNWTRPTGSIVGGMTVFTMPTNVQNGQILVWYPPSYFTSKDSFPAIIFHTGDGENTSVDITQALVNSLPKFLAAGMKAYSIVGKDTIWYIVITIHNIAGSSFRTQQAQIFPWIKNGLGLRIKGKFVVTGLSGGGSATYAAAMIGRSFTKQYVGVVVPMANWGWDLSFNDQIYRANFDSALVDGLYTWEYIGTQDPGYNSGGNTYGVDLKKFSLPGRYHLKTIVNGTHSSNVWDVPWKDRTFWDSLGMAIYTPTITTPPVISKPHARILIDSTIINYPNSVVKVSGDSSYCENGKIISHDWYILTGANTPILNGNDSNNIVCVSGLIPGLYTAKLVVTDSLGNKDSSFVAFKLNAVTCPVCPPVPVCPQPRTVVGVIQNADGTYKFVYSDELR